MKKEAKKAKRIALLCLSVALCALITVVLTVTLGSADEPAAEIQNVAYQTIASDSPESSNTDLRFLFTVGSLSYEQVGFVFSKTNENPTVGGTGCTTFATSNVHSAVRADGKRIAAPGGRFWVAVKVTGIPNASFDEPIYIRPFVNDGSEIRYSVVRGLSVEGAFAIPTLQTEIASFTNSNFGGGSVTTNLAAAAGKSYSAPLTTPTEQHPRVLFNASDIDDINATRRAGAHASVNTSLLEYVADPTDGILPAATSHTGDDKPNGTHNYDEEVLYDIQALAFYYRLTGDLLSGYRAVYAIKNYLKTIDIQSMSGDQERQHGNVMFAAACVYDWCYDLLTATDKEQIVLGVEKKIVSGSNGSGARMEVGFPPTAQQAMTGHGSERQILRDYLAFAIAIYDEYPGWWTFIAGRFYEEFVPVRNAYYEAGYVPQGISDYFALRFGADLYSAWLVKAATGVFPYASEADMKQVMRSAYVHVANGYDRVLEEGDDENRSGGETLRQLCLDGMISGYLFDDDTAMSWAAFKDYAYVNDIFYLILQSGDAVGNKNNRYDDLDLITYNGAWLGQMISQGTWDLNESATVLMKIGGRMTGNHDHADAGSFQIYYKGFLAGDSGTYDTYGSNHHTKYHQATIAHNSIVLQTGSTVYGQKQPGEVGSLSAWENGNYDTGTVTGVQYAYADAEETTPIYAYLAGDVSAAYVSGAGMTRFDRRMLAVYDTDNAEVPLYFFVFDDIASSHSSYKKIFLLHTKNEPTIEGKTVTTTHENGKLVLQNVFGGDSITKRAGYYVGSTNYTPATSDDYWGRVEISPTTGSQENVLLNVMYVCHKDDSPSLSTSSISTAVVKGAVIGNTAAVFVTAASRRTTEFSFTASGEGYLNYYVSGVAEGDWSVVVGGDTIDYQTATAEGGVIRFTAPAGTAITLCPGRPNIAIEKQLGESSWPEINFGDMDP